MTPTSPLSVGGNGRPSLTFTPGDRILVRGSSCTPPFACDFVHLSASWFAEEPLAAMVSLLHRLARSVGTTPPGALPGGGVRFELGDGRTLLGWADAVRVLGPDGYDEFCWVSDEWQTDPETVIGALFAAIALSEAKACAA